MQAWVCIRKHLCKNKMICGLLLCGLLHMISCLVNHSQAQTQFSLQSVDRYLYDLLSKKWGQKIGYTIWESEIKRLTVTFHLHFVAKYCFFFSPALTNNGKSFCIFLVAGNVRCGVSSSRYVWNSFLPNLSAL